MSSGEIYRAPAGQAWGEWRDRGSRFLAWVQPAIDEIQAQELLKRARERFPDATHHCFAWRLGDPPQERSSDDGEPHGTAGRPILTVLAGADISDVSAVVMRWFGGVKLGKGGLARAYSGAVSRALEGLPIEEKVPRVEIEVTLPYDRFGALERLIHPPQVAIIEQAFDAQVSVRLAVWRSEELAVRGALADAGIEIGPGPSARS
ncbi:MAG TPA: YigZ family protein [Thermoanaerobaculia bacterium]|nr:YigZ family protein [Thermoanaerobaculia bacterium]